MNQESRTVCDRSLQLDKTPGRRFTWWCGHSARRRALDRSIVARPHDNIIGQAVIIAAGISEEETVSPGEILYNSVYLDRRREAAPQLGTVE